MPKGKRGFSKGDPNINRKGAPKLLPELLETRKLTQAKLELLINKYLDYELGELKSMWLDEEARYKLPAIEAIILKIIYDAVAKGDTIRFDFVLNRTIGKIKEVRENIFPEGVTVIIKNA